VPSRLHALECRLIRNQFLLMGPAYKGAVPIDADN
jgi:hypothetical protein